MNGQIKWFSNEKGYGFIVPEFGSESLFFHISEYRSNEPIQIWDAVSYELGMGRNGKKSAKNVQFVSRGILSNNKPYYAKKTTTQDKEIYGAIGGAVLGAAAGPLGLFLGALIGAAYGSPQEITSTCLRCNGIGHVTAIDENFIGFQCKNCKAFWRKRNKDNLRLDDLNRYDN